MAKRKHRLRYKGPDRTAHVNLNPGDIFEITLGDIDDNGAATALLDGAPVVVAGGLPGEVVVAEVQRRFPDRIAATVTRVLQPSPNRVVPECEYFLACSGCQWQHVSYDHQLVLKRDHLQREIDRYQSLGHVKVEMTVGSKNIFGYRNHGRFTVGKHGDVGQVGYVNAITRKFLRIETCLLMDAPINRTLALVQDRLNGHTQVSIRAGFNTESVLVQPRLDVPNLGISTGDQHYEERVRDASFRVAASSFFQVNTSQLSLAVDELRDLLKLDGSEFMVDAYCGVGVFSVLMAPYVSRIVGIEESASAIQDAKLNSKNVENVEFVEGKTEHVLGSWSDSEEHSVDIVLLDPPRIGCHEDVIHSIRRLKPKTVLMVSCDASAMARDLDRLCSEGLYRLEVVRPVDMFPQTRHVEAISLLTIQDVRN